MGVWLDQQEIADFLTNGHTLIVSTIDKDGYPHSTPVWYVYDGGHVYFRVRSATIKAKGLLRNPKVAVLVESGERWRDLKAVLIRGRAEPVTDTAFQVRFDALLDAKYANFREAREAMPTRTQQHYATGKTYFKVVPEKRIASWDNRKIRM
ncbi:MAG: pyridoxamine 5'-phosphate oxidase family protein [Chloroflexi bacterium]|nr:pyridoxamine 5'-phosphate oxidase family protein [Chloroflexota bacterium]